jgi:hypothetical protein
MAAPSEHRALAASLVTEARQLGAMLGVAAMGWPTQSPEALGSNRDSETNAQRHRR